MVENGTTLTGTSTNKLITIAAGATVTLKGVNISHSSNYGIDCLGDATIILADGTTNTLSAAGSLSTLHVKYNSTLTIQGKGTLT